MASVYAWEPAPALPGLDPVSAWCLGEGRDFVPMLWDRVEAKEDHDYVGAIDADYPVPGNGKTRPPLVVLWASALREPGAVEAALQTLRDRHGMTDPRLYLMPLRKRMLVPPPRSGALPGIGAAPAEEGSTGKRPKALVGVIDHAINVLHARFRDAKGASRVSFAWDQGGVAKPGGRVRFGTEWTKVQLSGLLKNYAGDDVAGLREMGMLDFVRPGDHPLSYRQSHGTGVLDCAAGAHPTDKDGQIADILAVSLPPVVARESSGALLPLFLLQAFEYLLARSRDINAAWGLTGNSRIPLYVNASFGVSGGPRGGAHPIDTGIAGLIAEHDALGGGPVTVVFPAGNRNLAEGHASSGNCLSVPWRLQPGDRTSNYIDARITGSGPVKLTLAPPGGGGGGAVTLKPGEASFLKCRGNVIGRAVLEDGPNGALRLGIALAPTDPVDSGRAATPSGAWDLMIDAGKVKAPTAGDAEIEAWILRDDSPPGFSDGGRQSYFDDPTYARYDHRGEVKTDDIPPAGTVLRQGALNAISTATGRIVVGGHSLAQSQRNPKKGKNGKGLASPSPYTAGPLPEDRALWPSEAVTVLGVSDRSRVLGGVLAAGTQSGTRIPLNGTSVAAPQAVRLLAAARVPPAGAAAFLAGAVEHLPPPKPKAPPPPAEDETPLRRRIGAGGLPPVGDFAKI